ncbi:hypothetical protein [Glutamicibacter halophytocola]|uniref:hypothetical protein n=1 Tax=Glutamicibacter halophytocola TaxID=1933880 RepID=UPI0015C570B6|nr:hypothetical protein [Glutamicibacter halophytocola]NQD39968.1 hypothetical protein [Glutamicibacter halophytocola]
MNQQTENSTSDLGERLEVSKKKWVKPIITMLAVPLIVSLVGSWVGVTQANKANEELQFQKIKQESYAEILNQFSLDLRHFKKIQSSIQKGDLVQSKASAAEMQPDAIDPLVVNLTLYPNNEIPTLVSNCMINYSVAKEFVLALKQDQLTAGSPDHDKILEEFKANLYDDWQLYSCMENVRNAMKADLDFPK